MWSLMVDCQPIFSKFPGRNDDFDSTVFSACFFLQFSNHFLQFNLGKYRCIQISVKVKSFGRDFLCTFDGLTMVKFKEKKIERW
jgi:hypothetical protein